MGFPGGLEALDGRCVVVLLEKLHARVEMGHGRFEEQVLGPHVAVQDGLERVPGKVEGLQVAVSVPVFAGDLQGCVGVLEGLKVHLKPTA